MDWDSYGDTAGDDDLYKDDDGYEDKHGYVDWNNVGGGGSDADANAHGDDEVEKVADEIDIEMNVMLEKYMGIEMKIEVEIGDWGVDVEVDKNEDRDIFWNDYGIGDGYRDWDGYWCVD